MTDEEKVPSEEPKVDACMLLLYSNMVKRRSET